EVLGRDRVGVRDDFFELGGHSLQAVQLVSRLTAALGRPVSVGTIFRATTVAEMAEVLDREATVATGPSHATPEANGASAVFAGRSTPPAMGTEAFPHITIEERPLLPLFAIGALAPVDSVALSYLPSSLLRLTGLDLKAVIRDWCGDLPMVLGVQETHLGRIGSVLLPRFDDQLYLDRRDLLAVMGDAVRLSRQLGARTVSLTGLLPSATGYGRDLAEALAGQDLPRITTGHATTTSAVVLAIRRALEDGGRSPAGERVGFVGLGSVGIATLRLMLSCLPHPAELNLCDIYQKRDELRALGEEVVDELGYHGEVHLLESRRAVPEEIYRASLIVGATNVPDLLDVERLAPGTILVDDSAPHVFRPDAALRRFRERGDILATEGGVLSAPEPLTHLVHVPAGLEPWMRAEVMSHLARSRPRLITGCVLSGLLSARFEHLPPTLGLIDRATALEHYRALDELGFQAAELHLDDDPLDKPIIRDFRARFGGEARSRRSTTDAPPNHSFDNLEISNNDNI
ncbi:MAG: hypothetical protein JO034_32025, partial [Singulisphaera sp.]|nr:hypothetical protein [Singulisphaera sp.]